MNNKNIINIKIDVQKHRRSYLLRKKLKVGSYVFIRLLDDSYKAKVKEIYSYNNKFYSVNVDVYYNGEQFCDYVISLDNINLYKWGKEFGSKRKYIKIKDLKNSKD